MSAYHSEQRVDVLDCTPSQLRLLLDACPAESMLPGLLLIGGEPVDDVLWADLGGKAGVRAINLYGPTECTVDATWAQVMLHTKPTIGRPLPGVGFMVTDPAGRLSPLGAPGELLLTGTQVADGYLGDDVETARHFVNRTGPTGGNIRAYRTGDRVRLRPDGLLDYIGRVDDQVNVRGVRIEPGEIAGALRQHPDVQAAAATARGEGPTRRLVAYAVRRDHEVDPARLAGINPHETRFLYDEIFIQQTYLRGGVTLPAGATVFDVGANIGMFSLFVWSLVPDARLYAFEPVRPVFAALRENLARLGGGARLFNHGLSDSERSETFTFYPGYSMMSGQQDYTSPEGEMEVVRQYLVNERDLSGGQRTNLLDELDALLADRFEPRAEPVMLRRLSDVIDAEGIERIDLLKIDVQRAELDVLNGLEDRHWPMVQQVAMEVHDAEDGPTHGRARHITELLESRGFTVLTEQDALLEKTDRHNISAVRAVYRETVVPAPVRAARAVTGSALRD
ncbi:FkbM family methyltransferase [Micromonospora sp. WMMA1976]|uniref:FkbM family methyltransferase n=1 Tax=Micromonospora sp. WMMA1976 TaxID=3014995 RepID=UPI00248AAA41|nr:FkbM family methyltransferase [Micromonospora sp. WMMA1976]WBC01109.1 FkbM family methyltransferase [Micromonospora sp. WMMA1976]